MFFYTLFTTTADNEGETEKVSLCCTYLWHLVHVENDSSTDAWHSCMASPTMPGVAFTEDVVETWDINPQQQFLQNGENVS